jgi:cytochrome bd-type quinol oxidase subunit 2
MAPGSSIQSAQENTPWYQNIPLLQALLTDCRAPYFVLWFVYFLVVLVISFPLFFRENEVFERIFMWPLLFYLLLILVLTITIFTLEKELNRGSFSWFVFTLFILWLAFSLLWAAFFFDAEYVKNKYRLLPPSQGDRSITVFLALVSTFLAFCLTVYHCHWLLLVPVLWGGAQIYWSLTL